MAGSLIKNPGGTIAPCGGYIAGKREWVEAAAARLSAPGIGMNSGSTSGDVMRQLFQGLFLAPQMVGESIKVEYLFFFKKRFFLVYVKFVVKYAQLMMVMSVRIDRFLKIVFPRSRIKAVNCLIEDTPDCAIKEHPHATAYYCRHQCFLKV